MQWVFSFLLEFLYYICPGSKRVKQIIGAILILIIASSSFMLFAERMDVFSVVVLLLMPFRLLNISRVIKGRMHPNYLKATTTRTGISIAVLHCAGYLVTLPTILHYYNFLPLIQSLIATIILCLTLLHIYKTRHVSNKTYYSDLELPTVSICIPARNETDSLEQCLRSVLANDYPKLEVLVLDDCSQDKTAEVIKSFAHQGVRFVPGKQLEDRWLAKNQAYHKLLNEATGDYVLFCGVDVRFGPHAIKALVTTLLNRKKIMISIMPLRFYSKISEAFVQPMRYWWEIVPPRKLVNRPPVLSTCWLVNRKKLIDLGGFKAVSHTIIPEGVFAREFIKNNHYAFIRADKELDVRTTKPFNEQWQTAIRTNYPQIRKRPEMALLLTIFTFSVLIMPFVQVICGLIVSDPLLTLISLSTCFTLTGAHVMIMSVSNPSNIPISFVNLPVAAFMEIIVGYSSMLGYEFGAINWKNRNVCIPVMHTIPKQDFMKQLESKN